MSIVEEITQRLAKYPEVAYQAGPTGVTVRPQTENGSPVSLSITNHGFLVWSVARDLPWRLSSQMDGRELPRWRVAGRQFNRSASLSSCPRGLQYFRMTSSRRPNPRMQRTPSAPLSREPFRSLYLT
jgi:hypothetical protein